MPKTDNWPNLSKAVKNRLNSMALSHLPFAHVTIPQQVTETRKNGMARAIRPPMHCRRGYGLYVRAATKTKRPTQKTS